MKTKEVLIIGIMAFLLFVSIYLTRKESYKIAWCTYDTITYWDKGELKTTPNIDNKMYFVGDYFIK